MRGSESTFDIVACNFCHFTVDQREEIAIYISRREFILCRKMFTFREKKKISYLYLFDAIIIER